MGERELEPVRTAEDEGAKVAVEPGLRDSLCGGTRDGLQAGHCWMSQNEPGEKRRQTLSHREDARGKKTIKHTSFSKSHR